MLQKTSAVVLHALKYGDSQLVVDAFTESDGRVSLLVRLPRSRTATLRPALFMPLSLLEVEADFRPIAELVRLKQARTERAFTSLPYDPRKSAMALYVAEFLYRALRQEGSDSRLFGFVRNSVLWLDAAQGSCANFHIVFLLRLARYLGFSPDMRGYRPGHCFDLLNACFTPSRPVDHSYHVGPADAALLPALMRLNYANMHRFAMTRTDRERLLTLIEQYYRLHLSEFPPLRSPEVLRQVFGE